MKVATDFAAALLDAMNKGQRAAVTRRGTEQSVSDIAGFLHTGCTALDYYLTPSLGRGQFRGGYPLGRVIEVFGPEGAGKSTLATHALLAAQRGEATLVNWEKQKDGSYVPKVTADQTAPGVAALIDSETAFDKYRAAAMGLDCERLLMPDEDEVTTMEQELDWIVNLLEQAAAQKTKDRGPVVVVWDSVAASQPKDLKEAAFGEGKVAARARLLQQAMRRIPFPLAQAGGTLICVNQVQDKIGGMPHMGPMEVVPGGRALKFRSTVRLRVSHQGSLKEGDSIVGKDSWVKVIRSKFGPETENFPMPIHGALGIDDDLGMVLYLIENKSPVVSIDKGKVHIKVEEGKEISAPLRGGGFTALMREQKGLRVRLRSAIAALQAN